MPVGLGIWKINPNSTIEPVAFSPMDMETRLEAVLASDVTILDPTLMIVGRQVRTQFGGEIDLLAIDSEGDLCIVELKRDKTPREVVAQILDYASWVQSLGYEEIVDVYSRFQPGKRFEEAFSERFGISPPDALNTAHRLIVVAAKLDDSTERIIAYLSALYDVPINAVFFRYFRQGADEYLARTWLIDPIHGEGNVSKAPASKGSKEFWNGQDFYVNFEEGPHRTWEDAVTYGFVSAGQGRWYSRTLDQLEPGSRFFVYLPQRGYSGVGIVKEKALPVRDFKVTINGAEIHILDAPLKALHMGEHSNDDRLSEYLVRVEWLKTVPRDNAIRRKGMFANQNTVCKLRNKFTLDILSKEFDLAE